MSRQWMKRGAGLALAAALSLGAGAALAQGGPPTRPDDLIAPTSPIPRGKAPHMEFKLLKDAPDEKVYVIVFHKGDEVLSGLTDFINDHKIGDAHFTGIGAVSSATIGWMDLPKKGYRPIHVDQQVEILSMMGDVATFQGAPAPHLHVVLGKSDGSTLGGHAWELNVDPTIEIFMTVNTTELPKRPDEESGMRLIDPLH